MSGYESGGNNPPLSVFRPIATNYGFPTVSGPTPTWHHTAALITPFADTATTVAENSPIDRMGMRL